MTPPYLSFVLVLLLAIAAHAQPGEGPPPDQQARMRSMMAARQMAQAVIMYSHTNNTLPADMAMLFEQGILPASMGEPSEDGAAIVIHGVPYSYLGLDGVAPGEVPDWSDIAIGHRSLDHPFAVEPGPGNPEGAVLPVAFLDGHVEMVSPAEARWLIGESRQTLQAIRDGAPLAMHRQIQRDAARLAQAMLAHAAAHEGTAPSDWASTFEHLSVDAPEGETDADRLTLYLSPRTRENTFIPPFEDDAERDAWINSHSMWRSDAHGTNLWHVPNPSYTVLLYSQPNAWVEAPDRRLREHVRKLAFAMVDARSDLAERDLLDARARHAHELFASLREGAPLPPLDDAMHDLRALARAITAFARDNQGYLPPDLGELLPYLDRLWGIHESEPVRVFLTRAHEARLGREVQLTPDWIRAHASYVYLGDPTVRMKDLRGTGASILLHAPLDQPFDGPGAAGAIAGVPFAGPPLSPAFEPGGPPTAPVLTFPRDVVEEQAAASRQAILKQAQK
ncbi:MAG: hypothetical protein ACIAS6_11675 [Phycisphaerales bacterium JB060]